MDVASLLFGHSKALYSTWIFYKPDRLLIDCGEGAATALGNGGYAIERVLLTHGHIDHISGLPSLLWSRASGMGDNEKPLEIYHPKDDPFVADMKDYLTRTATRLPFSVRWIPLDAGDGFDLDMPIDTGQVTGAGKPKGARGGRRLSAFATRHIRGKLTLGYKITEKRRRLKAEFAGMSQDDIRDLVTSQGRGAAQNLMEEYEAILATFGGDGLPLDPAPLRGCELLLHEATLLNEKERKQQSHSTLDEAIAAAVGIGPRALVLYHVSGRYNRDEVARAAQKSAARHGATFAIWCLYRDRLWPVVNPVEHVEHTGATQKSQKEIKAYSLAARSST